MKELHDAKIIAVDHGYGHIDRYYRAQDDPYFETREREEHFVHQIVSAAQAAMEKAMPLFLAGCMAGVGQLSPATEEQSAMQLRSYSHSA